MAEVGTLGGNYSMSNLQKRLSRLGFEGKDRLVRDCIYRAKKQNWIREDLKLTEEGRRRIESFIPRVLPPRSWDGRWYLTSFDIPEKIRYKRDILRENLKKLGFAPLHASCWISAINYLLNIQEIINYYRLQSYVILAETDKLGQEDSRTLANRVWKLDKINQQYSKFISKWKEVLPEERFWLQFEYLNILKQDPQLPKDLLPDNWQGEEAHRLGEELIKNI